MRWEFILVLNLLLAALMPWASLIPRLNEFLILIVLVASTCLFELVLFVSWSLDPQGDFSYFSKLFFLHLGPSMVSLSLLLISSRDLSHRWLRILAALLFSLGLSMLGFLMTPSMSAMDPFWGLIPGPIDMDPIIDLDFYWLRLWTSLLGWMLILILGWRARLKPMTFTLLLWLPSLILCQFTPGPYSSRFILERSFPKSISADSIEIFSNQTDIARAAWLEEFLFLKSEILKRLPPGASPNFESPLRIFVYPSDLEKKKWIGAERTQIGNFLRGEMHLSEIELDSPVVEHELTHLIHGRIRAPLKTYLDPFWFEGFAVGLTEREPSLLELQASALFRVLETQGRPIFWPHFSRFFSEFPPQASYRLAGAYAAQALRNNEWPWNAPRLSPAQFKNIDVTNEFLSEASRILDQKPLQSDPLRRDCSRLFRNYRLTPKISDFKSFLEICSRSPLAYEAVFALGSDRELALRLLSQTEFEWQNLVHADLDVLTNQLKNDSSLYANCVSSDCKLKAQLLREGRARELYKILSESKTPRLDLRRAFLPDTKFAFELSSLLPRSERIAMFDGVSKKRKLSPEEAFLLLRAQIYEAIESGLSSADRKKWLKELQPFASPHADRLRRRLLF